MQPRAIATAARRGGMPSIGRAHARRTRLRQAVPIPGRGIIDPMTRSDFDVAHATHRLAVPADLDAVHAIYMHERVVPYLGFDPMPRAEFVAVFEALLAGGGFHVVECRGLVCAFYRLVRHDGRARHVAGFTTFAVAPAAHGSGLADAVLETALARARAAGALRIELMVEADNPRAIAFYGRHGFVLEGRQRAAYRRAGEDDFVDELLMAKLFLPGRG
jgi:ribosomal protein S18 acetylase RimI-like enzyme